jgi:hypothetical protein
MRLFLLVVADLMMTTTMSPVRGAPPEDFERYRVIPLTKANDIGNTVLIIDTQTGDLWKWFESSPPGNQVGGSGIRYEGAAVPGTPGEIVARTGFELPSIQRSPAGK